MFFRREKPKVYTFDDRLSLIRAAGFQVDSIAGKTRARRGECAAELSDAGEGRVALVRAGRLVANEIGALVDLGYQKVWQTPGGRKLPATAEQLKAVHGFTEDLREALGLTSFYNQGLGSTNDLHLYDRVEDRDFGAKHPWEHR